MILLSSTLDIENEAELRSSMQKKSIILTSFVWEVNFKLCQRSLSFCRRIKSFTLVSSDLLKLDIGKMVIEFLQYQQEYDLDANTSAENTFIFKLHLNCSFIALFFFFCRSCKGKRG